MGLRLYRDPDEDSVPENAAAKLDRAAATRRSTIRREPSVRPGRDHVPQQSISFFLRSRHQDMLRTRDRLRQEERDTDAQIAQLQAEVERLRRNRLRNRLRLHDELGALRAGRDSPESPVDQSSPDENGGSPTEGSLDETRPALPRPPRESNLRFELLPSSTSRSSSPWRYQVLPPANMPSPPRSSGSERRDASIPDGPIPGDVWSTSSPALPALTEGFAPARPASHSRFRTNDRHRLPDEFQGLETPPPESWESSYPPLHRVSHSSPRPPRVDGLGDRRRSLSPSSPHNEEDTWMSNLLTTMDASHSSSSSFVSSRSDGIRRSNNSSQTTSTSFGEIGSLDDTCELDLPEGITENDVREIRERHSNRPSADDPYLISAFASIRGHMNRVGNHETEVFEAIVARICHGEHVPSDWWEAIGMPPDFGRRVR